MVDLKFLFIGIKPCSSNDAYVPAYKYVYGKGRRRYKKMYMHKSDELKNLQDEINKAFEEEFFYSKDYLMKVASYINNLKLGFELKIVISLPKSDYYTARGDVARHDASNFIKNTEDAIMSNLGIDDRRNVRVSVEKGYNEDGVWMIDVELVESSIHNKINVETRGAYIKEERSEVDEA